MKYYIALGYVTEDSVKIGCPKPLNTAITKKFTSKREASKWIKDAKLRDSTIMDE